MPEVGGPVEDQAAEQAAVLEQPHGYGLLVLVEGGDVPANGNGQAVAGEPAQTVFDECGGLCPFGVGVQ